MLLICKSLLLAAVESEKKGIGGKTCEKKNMEKKGHITELLHGHFHFKVFPDGGFDRNKVICNHWQVKFSYHRNTSSLQQNTLLTSANHSTNQWSKASAD